MLELEKACIGLRVEEAGLGFGAVESYVLCILMGAWVLWLGGLMVYGIVLALVSFDRDGSEVVVKWCAARFAAEMLCMGETLKYSLLSLLLLLFSMSQSTVQGSMSDFAIVGAGTTGGRSTGDKSARLFRVVAAVDSCSSTKGELSGAIAVNR